MSTFLKTAIAVIFLSTLVSTRSQAQFQVNVLGSRAMPTGRGSSLSDGVWGAGITLRYFTSPRLAVGLNTRYYTNRYSYAYGPYFTANQISNVIATGQADYFFATKTALQPYAGAEFGVINSRYKTEFVQGPITDYYSSNESYLLVGPKVGLQYAITPAIGLNVEASYQFIIDRSYTEPVLFINAGGFIKFGRR